MTHKALLRQLQISCLGLDAVDPLRLLVDDVIAALAQQEQEPVKYSDYEPDGVHHNKPPQRTWVGLTDEEKITLAKHFRAADIDVFDVMEEIETELKEKNT